MCPTRPRTRLAIERKRILHGGSEGQRLYVEGQKCAGQRAGKGLGVGNQAEGMRAKGERREVLKTIYAALATHISISHGNDKHPAETIRSKKAGSLVQLRLLYIITRTPKLHLQLSHGWSDRRSTSCSSDALYHDEHLHPISFPPNRAKHWVSSRQEPLL